MDADEPPPQSREAVFSLLKPHCAQLLDLLRRPRKSAPFLPAMARLLRRSPAHLLQPSLDYALIPLLLVLDAAVECRSLEEGAPDGRGPFGDLRVSDNVAEGIMTCLEELLRKCHLVSTDQMVSILKKLAKGAMLSPSEASEEFREGIVLCLRALLLKLEACIFESCMCRQGSIPHVLTCGDWFPSCIEDSLKHGTDPKECLLSFIRSQDASAAVGHWLSLLFQTAEIEVARGLRGSAKLRKEAFLTLRVLIMKSSFWQFKGRIHDMQACVNHILAGTSDSLAFFLPGVVSRFAKALHASTNTFSGAASSSESIDHAVRGFAEFLSIVLSDEANQDALNKLPNGSDGYDPDKTQSSQSVLAALRDLSLVSLDQRTRPTELANELSMDISCQADIIESTSSHGGSRIMFINRTGHWIKEASSHVDNFLSATFPHLCVHPSERVRKAVLYASGLVISTCCRTLKNSKMMLLECLCVLVCDDSESVSSTAHEALASLLTLSAKFITQNEIAEIFNGLIENLPRVVLGNEEAAAVSQAQKLFALMYYVGPAHIISSILCLPMKVGHFLNVMASCMSQNSQFSGPVRNLLLSKPLQVGYLHSITELKVGVLPDDKNSEWNTKTSLLKGRYLESVSGTGDYKIPAVPPWFTGAGNPKLYASLAGVVRLIGLSVLSGGKDSMPLSVVIDIPLDRVRKLISDLRLKEYNEESWKSWYNRRSSGQLLRDASTAVCILNEMMYGASKESINLLNKLFRKSCSEIGVQEIKDGFRESLPASSGSNKLQWNFIVENDFKDHLVHCVGSILHEYMAHEIWDLPVDQKSFLSMQNPEEDPPLYLFHDATVLQQIIVEGIGIFSLLLGSDFKANGFMHNSLFLLLQNLLCSNHQVKTTCDAVLKAISTSAGYPTVGHLVIENADYIVDSLCQHLRHLDIDPQTPNVLSAMLSFIGVAQEILPLLEEPMRIVSLELEVLGRHQHPKLTDPFLKAVFEIAKTSKLEACQFFGKYELFCMKMKSKVLHMKDRDVTAELNIEEWEESLLQLNEMRRYRRIVGSVAESCLKAAIPLIASKKESICLVALNIIEHGSSALANVEKAYKLEKESKESIEEAIQLCSFQQIEENADLADEGDENRVLPSANKIWPYLIICLKNKSSVAVVRRCMQVLSFVVQISGGDFFVRRFRSDGMVIWQLLSSSPFRRKSLTPKGGRQILLPYRSMPAVEESMAEASSLKVQEAALNMIADIAGNENTATALEAVQKKASGLVVGIACSTITGLREASIRALSALACMDSDLIWLLIADIYYALNNTGIPCPPMSSMSGIHELLPKPPSSKEYLYLQYGGEGLGFDIDPSMVERLFQLLQSDDLNKEAIQRI